MCIRHSWTGWYTTGRYLKRYCTRLACGAVQWRKKT